MNENPDLTALFHQAEDYTRNWLRPGSGLVTSISQIAVAQNGGRAIATASICDVLEGTAARDGAPSTRIAAIDLDTGDIDLLTQGCHSDHSPSWSPDGRTVAFISDREQAHVGRLRIFDLESRVDRPTAPVDGFVESLQWSTDGRMILLGVAGFGSDVAGAQGAFAVDLAGVADEHQAWSPIIEGAPEEAPWRTVWLYDVADNIARQVSPAGINVWQACWCGRDRIAAICSDLPHETDWYTATVRVVELGTGKVDCVYRPRDQLGRLTASPSGQTLAVIDAVCSDRGVVAGDIRVIDLTTAEVVEVTTTQADVSQIHWRGEDSLLFVGVHGPETVVGLLERRSGRSESIWRSAEHTASASMLPEATPFGEPDGALIMREAFFDPPTLVAIERGKERVIRRFGTPESEALVRTLGTARDVSWTAPDGLKIHGWLVTPPGNGPHPLIMHIHGGPVWLYRPAYLGRSAFYQMALAAGYALFLPNVRGSSGRGQAFARHVFGDMGGKDTFDYLSGLDALQSANVADPGRIGVTGGSYGGYMSAWLITQDRRFAAAVPVAPIANWVSQHLTCNVPSFCETFLDDEVNNPNGKYFSRSPIHYVQGSKTPTLTICGALDRITPPTQALEFHRALQSVGVESVLATYPLDGHGVRTLPAAFDCAARTMDWFLKHMSNERSQAGVKTG